MTPKDGTGGATVTYAVTARPAFDVPGFILKRLLRRDSPQMVDSLRREISRANLEAIAIESLWTCHVNFEVIPTTP